MLSKLLSLLVAGKGGVVAAAVVVAGATTVGAMTSSTDLQDSLHNVVQSVTGMSQSADKDKDSDKDSDCEHGKPVVVAQRNAADKQLRTAFEDQHKRLEHLRGGKDADHDKANAIIQKADRDLRGVLTKALNDVAALTLGREGQSNKDEHEGSPSPAPTCTPAPSASPTVLTAQLQSIVNKAIAEMKAIVDKAAADAAALPTPSPRGKEDEHKPSASLGATEEHGKPSATSEHGKSDEHRPTASPTPTPAH